jgi:hypothetical protein
MIVGSITLVLFLANAVMYAIEMFKGTPVAYHRLVSIGAATGLLLQYALGFMLLGAGNDSRWTHWVLALVAILPVGMEHGMTANQTKFRTKSMLGLIASTLTFIIVLTVYAIGEMN